MNRSMKFLLLFFGWALVLTFPLGLHFGTAIPLGTEHSATVPYFNLWTLQWNIEQLLRGFPNYWNPPVFAPSTGVFAYSELEIITAFLALPGWLIGGAAAGYNSVIILFLTLNAFFAFALLRGWGISVPVAVAGGMMMQSLPFVAQEMGVLQLTAIFGLLWILFFLQLFLKRPTVAHGIGLAIGIPILFLTCGYYGLFGLIFIPPALWGLYPPSTAYHKKLLGKVIIFALLGILITAPLLLTQQRILTEHNFFRTESTLRENSASLADYLKTLDTNVFYKKLMHRPPDTGQRLFPGWTLLALAMGGAAFAPKRMRRVRWYLLGVTGLAFGLSLGLNLSIGTWEPYQLVRQFVPGMANLRSPFRFAMVGQMALVLLAGFGLSALWRQKHYGRWVTLTLVTAALVESLALPLPLQTLSEPSAQPWQAWISAQAGSPTIVLLPFAKNSTTAAFEQTTRWMLENSALDAQMLNGYSGFFPRGHSFLQAEMVNFPTPESIHLLKKYRTNYVVLFYNLSGTPPRHIVATLLREVFFDPYAQVSVFVVE